MIPHLSVQRTVLWEFYHLYSCSSSACLLLGFGISLLQPIHDASLNLSLNHYLNNSNFWLCFFLAFYLTNYPNSPCKWTPYYKGSDSVQFCKYLKKGRGAKYPLQPLAQTLKYWSQQKLCHWLQWTWIKPCALKKHEAVVLNYSSFPKEWKKGHFLFPLVSEICPKSGLSNTLLSGWIQSSWLPRGNQKLRGTAGGVWLAAESRALGRHGH